MGNQVHCTHSDQRHQPRILVWAGGFTQPSGWLSMAWPRSAQATKFAVPNWFVILAFCSEIWVTRSIALTLTSDISRGFWFGLADLPSRLAGLARVSPDNYIRSAKLVRNFGILPRNVGNQVHCTHSDQRHQPRILVWAGGFTQPSGWLSMAWPRSAQATKFAVPNWFVILAFCSEIWV